MPSTSPRGLAAHGVEIDARRARPAPRADQQARGGRDPPASSSFETGLPLDWTAASPARGRRRRRGAVAALAARVGADLVHLNSPALAAAARLPGAGRRRLPLLRRAPGGQAVRGGPLPRGLRAGATRARPARLSRRRRARRAERAPSPRRPPRAYGLPRAAAVVHNGRRRRRPRAGAAPRAASSSPPAGSGTRARTSPRSTARRARLDAAGPRRRAARRARTATRVALAHVQAARRARRDAEVARMARARARSSSPRRATSPSASRCSRRRRPAARWCWPTSRPSASCGTAPRSSSPPDDDAALAARASSACSREPRARAPSSARRPASARRRYTRRGDGRGHARASTAPLLARHAAAPGGGGGMRIVYFSHSLASCWNHGNAHFLRGVLRELIARGHEVAAFEPAGGWSLREPPRATTARRASPPSARAYPELVAARYDADARPRRGARRRRPRDRARVERARARRRARPARAGAAAASRSCSTTPTTARSATRRRSRALRPRRLRRRARLRRGARARSTRRWGWGERVWIWHEAADTRAVPSACRRGAARAAWSGSATGATTSAAPSCESFLLEPGAAARAARSTSTACAIPSRRCAALRGARRRATAAGCPTRGAGGLRAPPRDRPRAAPALRRGAARHPDHPRLRGAGLRHPAVSAPWRDAEGLFRPGDDFLVARDGAEMARHLAALSRRRRTCARSLVAQRARARSARATPAPTASTSCSPSCATLGAAAPLEMPHEDRVLRLEPGLLLLERRRHLLPRPAARPRRAAATAITFYEPDAFDRQQHRDIDPPGLGARSWSIRRPRRRLRARRSPRPRGADVVVKASGVGVFDDELLEGVVAGVRGRTRSASSGTSTRRPRSTELRGDPDAPVAPR